MPINQDQGNKGTESKSDDRTLEQLQDEARRVGISGFGMMNKSDLIKALQQHRQDVK